MTNPHDHRNPDPKWVQAFDELEHMIQHGLNLMTIALVSAREVLFGDDKEENR